MKICWDTIEGIYLTKYGNFNKNGTIYVEMPSCGVCGEPYLTVKYRQSNYCSHSCSLTGENHPQYGKKFSKEWRNKLSTSAKHRFSDNNNNPNYKGGVEKLGLPLFNTFSPQIDFAENTKFIYVDKLKLLQIKCIYCGRWFIPTIISVRNRIIALNKDAAGRTCGEGRFYCTDRCKEACPTFRMRKYHKGFKKGSSREVQPELRKMVFERDNYICQSCGKSANEIQINCHHIYPVAIEPIESADIDNCITLCIECHKRVHRLSGCNYHELWCKGDI